MRVLLVAPACDPLDVGEAWVGFQWASRLSARHEVTLLTYRKRDRGGVVDALPATEVVQWLEPPLLGRAERLNALLKPAYIPFFIRCRRWLAHQDTGRFDVALQVLPVAMRYPSPLAGSDIPVCSRTCRRRAPGSPRDSTPRTRHRGTWASAAWTGGGCVTTPCWCGPTRQAACVLGIAEYVRERLDGMPMHRFEVMSETALESVPDPVSRTSAPGRPVRLLFVGRLIRTKGVRDAVRAMGYLRDLPLVFDVVGDGFDRAACESLRRRAGGGGPGRLPRSSTTGHGRRLLPRRGPLPLPQLSGAGRQRAVRGARVWATGGHLRPWRPGKHHRRVLRRAAVREVSGPVRRGHRRCSSVARGRPRTPASALARCPSQGCRHRDVGSQDRADGVCSLGGRPPMTPGTGPSGRRPASALRHWWGAEIRERRGAWVHRGASGCRRHRAMERPRTRNTTPLNRGKEKPSNSA